MVKWNKICGMMALMMMFGTLGGCSNDSTTVSEVAEEIKTTEANDTEDSKLKMDDVILQVEDASVTYREVLFYLYQAKRDYELDLSKQVWDVTLKDGDTLESYAKEEILRQITEIHIICEQAKKAEVTLTASEEAQVENQVDTFLKEVSAEDIAFYGFTEESLQNIFMENAIAKKMYDKEVEGAAKGLDKDAYRQVQVQYIQVMTDGKNKNGKNIAMSDEQKQKAYQKASKILEKAKTMEDFESYAKSKSDSSQVNLEFCKSDSPRQFGEVALSLKTGEFSDVIEAADGYYIVLCVNDNVEEVTEASFREACKQKQSEAFQKAYTEWSKQYSAEVSVKLWKKIEIKND